MAVHSVVASRRGQAAVEFAVLFTAIVAPLMFGIVYVSEMYWTWHSAVEFTREGARYAATHCWMADTQNVVNYMQTHVPTHIDVTEFRAGGTAQINVQYYQRDPASGELTPFSCDGECSTLCVPDAVTVSLSNYEFRRFVTFLHIQPVVMPAFPTSMPIQSNGCDPEQNVCNP